MKNRAKSFVIGLVIANIEAFSGVVLADDNPITFGHNPVSVVPSVLSNSLVTYGVIDEMMRRTTNVNAAGQAQSAASQGLFNGTRAGIKGTIQLDNSSTKGIYTLEAGFFIGTGQSDQQGQIFGRQAWAGLQDANWGTMTFGRQYGNFADAVGAGDIFGERHGNMIYNGGTLNNNNAGSTVSENGFFYQELGYRWDNSLLYRKNFGAFNVGLMHAMASNAYTTTPGAPGATGTQVASAVGTQPSGNTMNSVSVTYDVKKYAIAGGYQSEIDMNGFHHNNVGVGGNYMYTDTNGVYVSYFNSKYDTGFTRINGTNSEIGGTLKTSRQDNVYSLGVNYYVTPNTNLLAASYFDFASNLLTPGDSGKRGTILALVDYYFGKSADVYLVSAYTHVSGALQGTTTASAITGNGGLGVINPPAGQTGNPFGSSSSVMAGFRLRF